MPWWSRSTRTAADASLERIEADRVRAEEARAEEARAGSDPDPAVERAHAHMQEVMRTTGEILSDVPAADQGAFMVVVGSASDDPAGVVVTAEQHEGVVTPGSIVSVVALPAGADDMEYADALLGTRALAATVVSYDASSGRVQLEGVVATDLTHGSMISR